MFIDNSSGCWGGTNSQFHPKPLHITKENKLVYLTVIWWLGITIFISITGIIGLSYLSLEVPQALIALGSVAVGALGSLFTHSGR